MRVIRNRPAETLAEGSQRAVGTYAPAGAAVAIGNFDGVHRGHLAVIDRCRQLATAGQAMQEALEAVLRRRASPEEAAATAVDSMGR